MRSPTIRDVAQRAGVGVGTVSRVINGSSQVADGTRQKVLEAIAELGFSPNKAARQLSGGKTTTVGVITPFFSHPSFVERVAGIQDVLDHHDYDLVLYSIRHPQQTRRKLREIGNQIAVDGLIVLSYLLQSFTHEELHRLNPSLPLIGVDHDPVDYYPHIFIDNLAGGQMAAEYLIAKGHRKIGFVGHRVDNAFDNEVSLTISQRRLEGMKRALHAAGIPFNEQWYLFGAPNEQAAREQGEYLLSMADRPTAIFAAYDTLAFGVLAAVDKLGMRTPDDIAIIGFDDIKAASYMGLTTINQQLFHSGELGAQYMLERLKNGYFKPDHWHVELALSIVERLTA
ncbi:MAG: LacI family DNA-binding transcriptional regulator [Chloroflexi bacterium]|nr:LacI family DNA-binding transcriptional regulator [Chloroflexota bacterium]